MKTKPYNLYLPLFVDHLMQQGVLKLRARLGWEGYGLYVAILQRLRSARGGRLPLDFEELTFAFRCDETLIKTIIFDFDLFKVDESQQSFTSADVAVFFEEDESAQTAANISFEGAQDADAENFTHDASDDAGKDVAETAAKLLRKGAQDADAENFMHDASGDSGESVAETAAKLMRKSAQDADAENFTHDSSSFPHVRARLNKQTKEQTEEQTNKVDKCFSDEKLEATTSLQPQAERAAEKNSKRKRQTKDYVRNNPPTLEELQAFAVEKGYDDFDAQYFLDYYSTNNWSTARGPLKNWRTAVVVWQKRGEKMEREAAEERERRARMEAEERERRQRREEQYDRDRAERQRVWLSKMGAPEEANRAFQQQRIDQMKHIVQQAITASPHDDPYYLPPSADF